jgi:hypothetical protein
MNRTARRVTKYCVEVYKLIIFFHSKCYRPSSILSHRQTRMRPATRSAQVAAKRGDVNSSTRLKFSLYFLMIHFNILPYPYPGSSKYPI